MKNIFLLILTLLFSFSTLSYARFPLAVEVEVIERTNNFEKYRVINQGGVNAIVEESSATVDDINKFLPNN